MKFTPTVVALALLTLLCAGCTTTQPVAPTQSVAPTTAAAPTPPPAPVAPPAPIVEAKPASITGSEESSTMLDNFTAFVAAVDGVPVVTGRAGWNTALSLKAGPRRLSVAFARGVFAAQAELQFTARSEAVYQLKFTSDAQLFGKSSFCEFWVVDTATGEQVGPRVRASLTKTETAK